MDAYGRLYQSGKTDEAVMALKGLIDQCTDDSAVKLGDILGVLVTHHAYCTQWKQVSHLRRRHRVVVEDRSVAPV